MITFAVDTLTSCLVDVDSGKEVDTIVSRIKNTDELTCFSKQSDWYVSWAAFDSNVEIYAVKTADQEVQGLIALEPEPEQSAVHILWGCTAPHNNPLLTSKKKYMGVGGHLFAVAGNRSRELGFDGFIYGEAANLDLYRYYIDEFGATEFPYGYPPHPYRIVVNEKKMASILEVYTYEQE